MFSNSYDTMIACTEHAYITQKDLELIRRRTECDGKAKEGNQ